MDRDMHKKKPVKTTVPARPGRAPIRTDLGKTEKIRTVGGFDKTFLVTVIILLAFGTIMIFSASYAYAGANMGDSYHYIKRQLLFAAIGIVVMYLMSHLDYKVIKLGSIPIFAVSLILMLLVTFSSSGEAHKGAARWLELGPLSFQPSEIFKLSVIIILADYIAHFYDKIISDDFRERIKYGFLAYLAAGVAVVVPFLMQKHLSGCIITLMIVACMMFLGGSDLKVIGLLIGICVIVGLIAVPILLKHSMDRFAVWFDPFSDLSDKGWQPVQSLFAVSSGGLWGVGFGASKQKQLYLPEPQNDYIFAILCEELGFIGAISVICIFAFLIYRGVKIALRAPDRFSSLLCAGIIFQVGLQMILNICVVTNTIPSTGISLPFFSYGGTSLVILMAEMGIVLNVSRYSLEDK
ncbi:MAG: putative lipid II flippase FtsW [Ruminococcaceae bacterium]|nr:putative lipid II flippase FtsW [Oscillospiraceae bacterium]